MKPRVFIGSSTEALSIAQAIQENLEYDAQVTVWTQRIFELSSTALDDLSESLDNYDFGIFVFNPEDSVKIRDSHYKVVRDNVIFEIGLFIGRLGKDKVFFVLPRNIDNLHLPSDLLGVTSGTYDNAREDGNLVAALGPFCNQVRDKLQNFVVENLLDLKNESKISKQIAIQKPEYWEYILASELLKSRLPEINKGYDELEKGLVFRKAKIYNDDEFSDKFLEMLEDIKRLMAVFKLCYVNELVKGFGAPGESGNIYEIKSAIDKMMSTCKEMLAWEYEVRSIIPPNMYKELHELMKGWTTDFINEINRLPDLIDNSFSEENLAKGENIDLGLTFNGHPNISKATELIKQIRKNL